MNNEHRGTRTAALRSAGAPGGETCIHHRINLRRHRTAAPGGEPDSCAATPSGGCADVWDVASWTVEPRRDYRFNTLFHHGDGAVITASGLIDSPAATAELTAALHPFERLGCTIVIDVCHAMLGLEAVETVVEVGLRHAAANGGPTFAVAHAGLDCRRRIAASGGRMLLRPPCDRAASHRRAS